MHWKVIDYKVLQKSHLAMVLESGKCKVIAYAMTQVKVRLDDKLSLAKDDFYRVNNTDDKKSGLLGLINSLLKSGEPLRW